MANMEDTNNTLAELKAFRQELEAHGVDHLGLLRITPWRPWADMALDAVAICLATALVVVAGWWWAPLAVLVIGNRQRALGNMLHDAAHRTIHRTSRINDWFGGSLLGPMIFVDLPHYRKAHFRHHMRLGQPQTDPDYLAAPAGERSNWFAVYVGFACSWRFWWGSLAGHLGDGGVPPHRRLRIAAWWVVAGSLIGASAGPGVMLTFLSLWLVSRATTFHLITTFREMCDHFGLVRGGVVSFTRDVLRRSPWYVLVHPRNNGYHLTHHLLPAVPYYRLPQAQRLLRDMPAYRSQGRAHTRYVLGPDPVVAAWAGEARGVAA